MLLNQQSWDMDCISGATVDYEATVIFKELCNVARLAAFAYNLFSCPVLGAEELYRHFRCGMSCFFYRCNGLQLRGMTLASFYFSLHHFVLEALFAHRASASAE